MKPYKLSPEISEMLSVKINDEYSAHYFYAQVANYCENVGYLKAAEYFKKESAEELEHSQKLQKYLTDWNVQPDLKPIKSPEQVNGLVDIIEKAYKMEYALYSEYEEISAKIFKDDICTFDFLQEFRTIQRLAVAGYSTLLNMLDLIDKTDKNWVYQFEKKAFKK